MREEGVLLGLVETVDFVDEQDCLPSVVFLLPTRFSNDFPNLFHTRKHGTEVDEMAIRGFGHDPGNCGFSGSRGAPEYHRKNLALFSRFPQNLSFPQEMLLSHEFTKRFRSNTFRQRDCLMQIPTGLSMKEIAYTLPRCHGQAYLSILCPPRIETICP